jgi:hypothetical protein
MRLCIFTERDPSKESDKYEQYPSLLFYLGSLIQLTKILNPTEVEFVYLDKDSQPVSDSLNDYRRFCNSIGSHTHVSTVPISEVVESSRSYDLVVGMILVGRKEYQYDDIDQIVGRSKSMIYFDGDTEPLLRSRTTFYDSITSRRLDSIRSKLKHVFVTEGSKNGQKLWSIQYECDESFVPYILHPYYVENNKLVDYVETQKPASCRDTVFASFKRLGKSGGVMNVAEEKGCKIILPESKCRCITPGFIADELQDSKVLMGTIATNVHEGYYRSASKIIESLHSGCLPTVIEIDEDELEMYKPYYSMIPKWLKVLRRPTKMDGKDFDRIANMVSDMGDREYAELASKLYRVVYDYHHPDKWFNEMKRVIDKIKKEMNR